MSKALEGEVLSPDKPATNGHAKKASAEIVDCFAGDETVTIHLDQVQWIRLRKELDYGDEQELNTALVKGYSTEQLRSAAAQGITLTHVNSGKYMLMRAALYIDDWNLLGKDGATVRLPRRLDEKVAVISRISKPIGDTIEAKIAEIRGDVVEQDDEQKALEAPDENPLNLSPIGSTPA